MAAEPSVETTVAGRGVVARISGELNYLTGPDLWERIEGVLAESGRFVVLDLAGVPFCDSAGLSVLLRAGRHAGLSNAELVLACVPPPLRRILELTGADQVLPVYDTVAEAQTDLDGRGEAGLVPQ